MLWNNIAQPASLLVTLSMAWYEDFLQVHQSNSSLLHLGMLFKLLELGILLLIMF